jgi:hypothetical protein
VIEPKLQLGFLEIFFPDASDSTFWFMADLVPHLRVGYQHEAEGLLKKAWRAKTGAGRLSLDHEADFTFAHASKPETIVAAAALVHELAGAPLEAAAIEAALAQLRAWKRPRRQRWKVGDVFAIRMLDSAAAYGQVLGHHIVKSPTTLLFETRHTGADLAIDDILALPIISILHTDGSLLDSGRWRVLGNAEPVVSPHCGPWKDRGISTADSAIEYLANAWYGLEDWNAFVPEDRLDGELMAGRKRPAAARLMSPEARQAWIAGVSKSRRGG